MSWLGLFAALEGRLCAIEDEDGVYHQGIQA